MKFFKFLQQIFSTHLKNEIDVTLIIKIRCGLTLEEKTNNSCAITRSYIGNQKTFFCLYDE